MKRSAIAKRLISEKSYKDNRSRSFEINLIVAYDKNYGIGKFNKIPWDIKEDMNYFTDITKKGKNAVIMGKNTWLSLNKTPLNDRYCIIISSSLQAEENNIFMVTPDIELGLDKCETLYKEGKLEKLFVIGGISMYLTFLKKYILKHIYISEIDYDYECTASFGSDIFKLDKGYECEMKKEMLCRDNKNDMNVKVTFNKYNLGCTCETNVNKDESNYLVLMEKIINEGELRKTRNAPTYSLFGNQLKFDLKSGQLPILTSKKVNFNSIVNELLFFMNGKTNTKELEERNVNIWKGNTKKEFIQQLGLNYAEGDMGPMYGFQWKHFNAEYNGCNYDYTGKGYDQLSKCVELLKTDPYSRRIIMTTFNPIQAEEGVLYPCHGLMIQFYVERDTYLNCHMYQRSADYFLGVPFNITSYSLMIHIMCKLLKDKYRPGELTISFGDIHIYKDHLYQARRQMLRNVYPFPKLIIKKEINELEDLNNMSHDDFELIDYKSNSYIKADMIA